MLCLARSSPVAKLAERMQTLLRKKLGGKRKKNGFARLRGKNRRSGCASCSRRLDPDGLSPKQAHELIYELVEEAMKRG